MELTGIESEVDKETLIDNRYQIVDLLATSEQEVLLGAVDKDLEDEEILIKVFHVSKDTKVSDLTRFKKEVVLTRRLSHPNISRVYDFGKYKKEYYYITEEKISGKSLRKILDENSEGLSLELSLDIIYQISNALIEAHSHGLIHRSVCPENIILGISDNKLVRAYLTNFNNGKIIGENFGLTKTGELIGNPSYMSPEQVRGEKLDERSDLYALGILAFEILTGRNPVNNSKNSNIGLNSNLAILNKEIPELNTLDNNIPSWVNNLIKQSLVKDRDKRLKSVTEFRNIILNNLGKFKLPSNNKKNSKKVKKGILRFLKISSIIVISLLIFKLLNFSNKEDIEAKNRQNILSLTLQGEEYKVSELLKSGVSPHTKDERGTPLIHLSVLKNNSKITYLLLENDKSVLEDTDMDGKTALHLSVIKEKLDLVELLLSHSSDVRADVNKKDNFGKSPLDYAIETGAKENKDNLILKKLMD